LFMEYDLMGGRALAAWALAARINPDY